MQNPYGQISVGILASGDRCLTAFSSLQALYEMSEDKKQVKLETFPELAPIIENLQQVQTLVAEARKRHRGPDKKLRKRRIDLKIMRLNKIVHGVLEPETRRTLLKELLEYHPGLDKLDSLAVAIFLAKWMRQQYMKWLPEVPKCPICEQTMEQGLYVKKTARTFTPNPKNWTGYDEVKADKDSLCGRVERWVCMNCFEVEYVGRENDVRILMHTRKGRCGEFSILYTSFLLALGFHARLIAAILDGDDHLWAEILIGDSWLPLDVSAEDPERIMKDKYLFQNWGWKLERVYAIEPGKLPVDVSETYRKV